jgi:hypothetical protein
MSKPFQIETTGGEDARHNRCSLKPLSADARTVTGAPGDALTFMAEEFGFCTRGACEACPLAKSSEFSRLRIEAGDTVRTGGGRLGFVLGFGERDGGLRTGRVQLRLVGGITVRLPLEEVTLYGKAVASNRVAAA